MNRTQIKKLAIAAMLLAIGYVLPFFTGQIQQIGNMLLPMHLPVMLAGLILGWQYGLAVGFITPITRSLIFGMPMLYPSAVAMAFELATYGAVIGLLYALFKRRGVLSVYSALIPSMLLGRAVWGIVMTAILGISGDAFTLSAFLAGAFLNAVPGIVLQLILIPFIMLLLDKTKVVRFSKR